MTLLLDHQDHAKFLKACAARKPKSVSISSFGIWAGINWDGQDAKSWGPKYQSNTRDVLESLRQVGAVRVLIGIADFKSCKAPKRCQDCETQYCKQLMRLRNHSLAFPSFSWRATKCSHHKCAIFEFPSKSIAVTGGRNFTDSEWPDCSVVLGPEDTAALGTQFDKLFKDGQAVTDEFIGSVFEENDLDPTQLLAQD